MPDWVIKLAPWLIGLVVSAIFGWAALREKVSSITKERAMDRANHKTLSTALAEISSQLAASTAEFRQIQRNHEERHDRRAELAEERMNGIDERSNIISLTNKEVVEKIETMSNRVETLTQVVLEDIGKKPSEIGIERSE